MSLNDDFKTRVHSQMQKEESYNAKKRQEHKDNMMKSESGTVCEATQAKIAEGKPSIKSASREKTKARRDYDSYASNNIGEEA